MSMLPKDLEEMLGTKEEFEKSRKNNLIAILGDGIFNADLKETSHLSFDLRRLVLVGDLYD